MRIKTVVSKKLIGAVLLGIVCAGPAIGSMPAAQAAPFKGQPHGPRVVVQSFTGVVTKVKSDKKFDVRIAGKIYNVYARNSIPRNLKNGSRVRISGQRVGNNDIRNAEVIVLRNRRR